jgi:SAM-dependent methyltransferase
MGVLKKLSGVMVNPTVYRLWQMPFASVKFRPVVKHNDMSAVRRVLDVGCGPGTNARFFEGKDYLGLDINPDYVERATKRYGDRFQVADVCTYEAEPAHRFDFILLNSLLHHIDDVHTARILEQLAKQLTPDGHIHILDLVLTEHRSVARTLALSDRGDFPRPMAEWDSIFNTHFESVVFESFTIDVGGLTLWNMFYFKGKARV